MKDKTDALRRNAAGPPENPPWGPDAPDPREERDRWRGMMERRIREYLDPGDGMTLFDCAPHGFAVAWYEDCVECYAFVIRWIDAGDVVRFPR